MGSTVDRVIERSPYSSMISGRRVSGAEAPDFGRAGDPAGDEHAARIEDRFLGSFNEEPAV